MTIRSTNRSRAKLADYRLQGATYALLLARITGRPVIGCRFVFIGPDQVREADLPDLDRAMADLTGGDDPTVL